MQGTLNGALPRSNDLPQVSGLDGLRSGGVRCHVKPKSPVCNELTGKGSLRRNFPSTRSGGRKMHFALFGARSRNLFVPFSCRA